ncbi:MAG: SGNH/GDSL hydrolase family protein [Methylobacterium frigidaeris]
MRTETCRPVLGTGFALSLALMILPQGGAADPAPPAASGSGPVAAEAPPPRGDAVRIVTLGTSLTARHGWQPDLAARLQAAWGRPVTVHAVARGGAGSRWGLGQVAAVLAHDPDIVLIEFAANDADLRRRTGLSESRDNHVRLIAAIRERRPGTRIHLMTMSPQHGLVRRWILRPFMDAYSDQYAALSREAGVGLIDVRPLWREDSVDPGRDIPDGAHPTRAATLRITVPAIVRALPRP